MPKVRRVARRKKYRHTINRKKLNRKMKKLPTIPWYVNASHQCKIL